MSAHVDDILSHLNLVNMSAHVDDILSHLNLVNMFILSVQNIFKGKSQLV
jgi:hypothetical protein